jgi:hypothetical protein
MPKSRPAAFTVIRLFGVLSISGLFVGCSHANEGAAKSGGSAQWAKVWQQIQNLRTSESVIPEEARQAGPPRQAGDKILFCFNSDPGVKAVYLAGNFNGWAQNNRGRVTNPRFAMLSAGENLWYREEFLHPSELRYNFVVETAEGDFRWLPDPHVPEKDKESHSIFRPSTAASEARKWPAATGGYPAARAGSTPSLSVQPEKVWVSTGQAHTLRISSPTGLPAKPAPLQVSLEDPISGIEVHTQTMDWDGKAVSVPLPARAEEGPLRARVCWGSADQTQGVGETILSTVAQVVNDLRYGFFSDYRPANHDYAKKADLLTRLKINAVEFYDYFPAHGDYAPREKDYKFEPFGIPISAEVAREKIRASGERGILSLAYVAAYAASESVYRQHPHPMTDEKGEPKIFNGEIMTEAEADRQKKPKWFWLMNVAKDSPWHAHIQGEFRRALDDDPSDQFSFDGFEIDSYGDNPDVRFYAKDSRRNGDKLVDVLHDFVGEVRRVTREVKPHGLVSFNSVNEFGADLMKDVTDFQFLEIWRFYTDQLEELVEICLRQREPRNQRVILKLYPADMEPKQTSWPAGTLARILGATMTGAGSLMVVGEPDETNSTMHGLNSLFYPDHTALRSGNFELLQAYYRHDAMLYGITHGPEVVHFPLPVSFSEGLTRTFASPRHQALVVQILRLGPDRRWSANLPWPTPLTQASLGIPLPGGLEPERILFVSPDGTGFAEPTPLENWKKEDGQLRVVLPPFCVYATLLLQYGPAARTP